MAVTRTLTDATVKMLLNNGSDPTTGEIRTVGVSIGSLNASAYDADKALAIASAVSQCLTKTLYRTQEITKNYIAASA
ncbi:MAG: hypothetical protein IJS42_01695 [Synergistaceae bacterium]|nr:hypothetical protein [Synergistaceae bacterium]